MVIVARDDGYGTKVYSAGHNGYGQLGHGDDLERHIKDLEGKLIKKVVAGSSHALALDMGGNGFFAWDRSVYGQVGVSDDHGDVYNRGFCESCATGHSSDKDITRPKKLGILRKAYGKTGSTNCHILEAAGGAQHSLMIVERFAGKQPKMTVSALLQHFSTRK
ncbi:MAG: hypothetical protein SGBAC_003809 [Bacillariaceae sp.]